VDPVELIHPANDQIHKISKYKLNHILIQIEKERLKDRHVEGIYLEQSVVGVIL
jgi:hypothetical protein